MAFSLFKYFKQKEHCDCLPDPYGPLNKQVPSTLIEEANKEVDTCYKTTDKEKKGSPYNYGTPEQKPRSRNMQQNMALQMQYVISWPEKCILTRVES